MKEREIPRQGDFYRHFKDRLYQIVAVATHSETGEALVVYQALYGDFRIYARPLDMFLSEVDVKKYPNATQKYRFEKVSVSKEDSYMEAPSKTESMEESKRTKQEVEPTRDILIEFLDARTNQDKYNLLCQYENQISDVALDSIGLSMDFVLNGDSRSEKIDELKDLLQKKIKYESARR